VLMSQVTVGGSKSVVGLTQGGLQVAVLEPQCHPSKCQSLSYGFLHIKRPCKRGVEPSSLKGEEFD
jgi:hypothetical protein